MGNLQEYIEFMQRRTIAYIEFAELAIGRVWIITNRNRPRCYLMQNITESSKKRLRSFIDMNCVWESTKTGNVYSERYTRYH